MIMEKQQTSEIALSLWEQGFHIIPLGSPFEEPPAYIYKKTKNNTRQEAINIWAKTPRIQWKQYQTKPPTEKEMSQWVSRWPNTNWGIITGINVVVVDGDSQDSCEFIEKNLTRTPWRVKTAKGYHYYYQDPPNITIKNSADPNIKIDIRGVGGYVVAAGSTHGTGVVYEWVIDRLYDATNYKDLPELTQKDLITINNFNGQFVKREATGNLAAIGFTPSKVPHDGSPVPEGGRNNAATSLAGQYIANGHSVVETLQAIKAWNQTNQPPLPDNEIETVVASVTASHVRNNNEPVLIEREKINKEKIKDYHKEPELDPHFELPGVLGEIVDYYMSTAPVPNHVLATQAALALGSVATGRVYQTEKRNFPVLFFLSLGVTGIGKEYGRTIINDIMLKADYSSMVINDIYTSGQAVVSQLIDEPNHICCVDEFGRQLDAMNKSNSNLDFQMVSKLMSCFGAAHSNISSKKTSDLHKTSKQKQDTEVPIVLNPSLILYGMTTPSTFYDSLSHSSVSDGFLNRFIIARTHAKAEPYDIFRDVSKEIPQEIIEWVKKIRNPKELAIGNLANPDLKGNDLQPTFVKLFFSDEAKKTINEFSKKIIGRMNGLEFNGMSDMLSRTNEIAMRLSIVIALAENPENRTIQLHHIELAQKYVEHYHNKTIADISNYVSESDYGKLILKCIDRIKKEGKRGITISRLKDYVRALRGLKEREIDEVKSSLLNHDFIVTEQVESKRKGLTYKFYYCGDE